MRCAGVFKVPEIKPRYSHVVRVMSNIIYIENLQYDMHGKADEQIKSHGLRKTELHAMAAIHH
jgi:hypothetical protein